MLDRCLILLASYNGEKYIEEQLKSILNQEKIDVDIVISDDVSTDSTLKIIEEFNDTRIRVLPNVGKFGSASKNFFRLMRDVNFEGYEYIAFADQDDIWNSNKIFHSIETIKNKNIDAYSSNVIAFWENGEEKIINKSQKQQKYDHFFSSAGPGCTYVFKLKLANAFKKVLIQKKDLSLKIDLHDWLIYAFARNKAYNWFIDSESTMYYRQHNNNEFGANKGLLAFVNRWKRSRNGWFKTQIIYTADFCDITNKQIDLLKSNTYLSRIKLLSNLRSYRRSYKEALFLGLTFLIPKFKK